MTTEISYEMPWRADFHVHTTFCDGKNTAEEMVLSAIEKGFSVLGFSGHAPMPFKTDWCMTEESALCYREEVTRLKEKYKGKIRIYCGIEQDYFSEASVSGYDFVIGSIHYVKKNGCYLAVDDTKEAFASVVTEHYCGDAYAFAEDYYRLIGNLLNKVHADIIGHFDLITKFNEDQSFFHLLSERYMAAWQSAVRALLPFCVPFEINTGAMSRGYRAVPYPAEDIMQYVAKHGGCAVLSSDSHRADTLGFDFDMAANMARRAGLPLIRQVRNINW